jgi:hypothetical protein
MQKKKIEDGVMPIEERVDSRKIVFEKPIMLEGEEYKEVTMRRPKGKDLMLLENIQGGPFMRDMFLISHLCGLKVKPDALLEVDAVEVRQLQGELKAFLLTTQAQMMLLQQFQK